MDGLAGKPKEMMAKFLSVCYSSQGLSLDEAFHEAENGQK